MCEDHCDHIYLKHGPEQIDLATDAAYPLVWKPLSLCQVLMLDSSVQGIVKGHA